MLNKELSKPHTFPSIPRPLPPSPLKYLCNFSLPHQSQPLKLHPPSMETNPKSQHNPYPSRILTILLLFSLIGAGLLLLSIYTTSRFFDSHIRPCTHPDRKLFGLVDLIQPPASAMHSMSDAELLWAASLAPQVKEYPFKRIPKVAFMFLTRGPLPLAALWEEFFKGGEGMYSVYIHSLPSYKGEFGEGSAFNGRQIPSQVTQWGEMSMCDAERRLLANALLDLSNERFILLSESCIPLYNFSTVYQYLTTSQQSFVGVFDDPGPHGRGRFNNHMEPEIHLSQWRKGAQWFEVNRKIAISMITDTKYYSKFKEFCRPACYVDEHYFSTMLNIEAPHLIANRSITWVDWSRGGPHPGTFGKADITEAFIKRILESHTCLYNNQNSSVCFLFARKFAPSALEPLLQLSPRLLGFG